MNEKKKIVFYYPDMFYGGVEMAILNLAKRIYKDYDLFFFYKSIISFDLAREFAKYGIPRNIMTEQAPFECDTLIYCSLWVESVDRVSFVKPRQKILWSHAMVPPAGTKFHNLPFMRKMDRVVSVSQAADQTIPRFYYSDKMLNKLVVINNIVNDEEVLSKAALETPELPLARDLNICTVARISREKGWHRVKIMCDRLRDFNIDFKWFIIGEGYFPDEVNRAHALLDSYPEVIFLGKKDNPFPYVKQMDYVALLSDFESWGLAITEGKILHKPIICTDFPAASEQVEQEVNGVIIPLNRYQSYRKFARKIIENKDEYTQNAASFINEDKNQDSVRKWRQLFESDKNEIIRF